MLRADGSVFRGELPAWRHRALQLTLLHGDSGGFVEVTPGTRARDGGLAIDRRRRREHFLSARNGDQSGQWLKRLLTHAAAITRGAYTARRYTAGPREEVFVGVAPRTAPRGGRDAVAAARFLWVDLDDPMRLDALWDLLAARPCHLLIESGGSGGVHAYWRLAEPLAAREIDGDTGEIVEAIERAHLRLIHRLGVDEHGVPNVADPRCADRARLMRLAGTVNYKTGRYARVQEANLALAPYRLDELIGDLPDPIAPSVPRSGIAPRRPGRRDPYRLITPPVYFLRLAGVEVPARGGLVSCPVPGHVDVHPSCSVSADPGRGWCCHASGCGASGHIYDLASVLIGGPCGKGRLRDEDFKRAEALVIDAFGHIPDDAKGDLA